MVATLLGPVAGTPQTAFIAVALALTLGLVLLSSSE